MRLAEGCHACTDATHVRASASGAEAGVSRLGADARRASPIPPPTRRRTTTRSPARSRDRASTCGCSRRASASEPCREADGLHRRRQPLPRSRPGCSSSRARLAVKALEHPLALARLGLADCDLLHLQWVAAPEADGLLLHTRRPLVFTAHDLLPRRTARHTRTWKRLFGRFDRIVTHSERGRRDARGVRRQPRPKLRVIPHPAFRSDPVRHDDGRTVLALGVIRPYKGLPDAIEAVSGGSRVPGCSSPAIRGSRSTSSGSGGRSGRVAARLPGRATRSRDVLGADDRRRLPLPRRARPVRRAAAGDRRGHPGGRLRRRRPRRDRRRLRGRPRRRAGRRRRPDGALRELLDDDGRARRGARGRGRPRARASPGTAPARRTCALYEELA